MSAQDKLDRRAAKHGLGSDERKRKIQKAKDFFSKPVPTYSKDELRKMGHPVEATDAEVKKKQDFLDRLRGKPPVKKESSAEYGKSMDRIKDKEKNAAIKPKDRETLGKLADLMKKQKRNEAYRKPTQAEIDADKKKDSKSKDSSSRYRDMKKKMYGNAMGGLKKEESDLTEALVKVTDVEFNYRDQLPNSPKTSDLGAIKDEWKKDRVALRDAVKKMGGLVTNTVAPSRGNRWVGTVTIGTRGDASKLDDKSIQKAVKGHGIEIHSNQFRESTNLEEQKYAVKYTHPTDKKSGKTTGPLSKAAADKKAAMGNRVDRVGGKYTVIPHVEAAGQEYTAVPIKTGDVSQADRLTIAKMDAIMKKRSKDKRQKEENIHFVKVGDGRDHMIVKTKADKPSDAVKKIKAQYPNDRVKLHKEENESVSSADKKPQNFRDPETGKMKVRMVPADRDVVRGDDKARVVRKKRFKHMRKEQMATGNSRVGKDGRDAFMKAFKDVQKTAAEIQKKKDADKK